MYNNVIIVTLGKDYYYIIKLIYFKITEQNYLYFFIYPHHSYSIGQLFLSTIFLF